MLSISPKQRCAEWSLVWESQNTRSCYNPASRLKLYWGFRNSKALVIWIFPADGALLNWWLNGIYSFLNTFPSLVKVLDEQLCVWSLKWNINRLSIKGETLYHPQEILRGFPCPQSDAIHCNDRSQISSFLKEVSHMRLSSTLWLQ